MSDVSRYFYSGSPFIPEPSLEIMKKIVEEANLNREPLQLTVAIEIRPLMFAYLPKVMSKITELTRKFGTIPQDIGMYGLGYDAPLVMLIAAIMAESHGDSAALSKVCPPTQIPQTQRLNDHVRRNISTYRSMIRQEPSGRLIFLNEEDHPCFEEIYYKVGVSAAKHMYIFYMQKLHGN